MKVSALQIWTPTSTWLSIFLSFKSWSKSHHWMTKDLHRMHLFWNWWPGTETMTHNWALVLLYNLLKSRSRTAHHWSRSNASTWCICSVNLAVLKVCYLAAATNHQLLVSRCRATLGDTVASRLCLPCVMTSLNPCPVFWDAPDFKNCWTTDPFFSAIHLVWFVAMVSPSNLQPIYPLFIFSRTGTLKCRSRSLNNQNQLLFL